MKAKVRMRIGPVSASFWARSRSATSIRRTATGSPAKGQGGAAGFAKGGAVSPCARMLAKTVLDYNVDAQVGGKIAQVGARLIDGTAKKLADEFFGKFAAMVGGPPPAAAVAGTPSDRRRPAAFRRRHRRPLQRSAATGTGWSSVSVQPF